MNGSMPSPPLFQRFSDAARRADTRRFATRVCAERNHSSERPTWIPVRPSPPLAPASVYLQPSTRALETPIPCFFAVRVHAAVRLFISPVYGLENSDSSVQKNELSTRRDTIRIDDK